MYAALLRAAPQPADQRLESDQLMPARRAWAGKYSAELLDIVDWCLRLDHLERPQSVLALQKALLGERRPQYHGKPPMFHGIKNAVLRFTGGLF
jgi:hypothetical protein